MQVMLEGYLHSPLVEMKKKLLNIVLLALLALPALAQTVPNIGAISSTQAHNVVWETKIFRQPFRLSVRRKGNRNTWKHRSGSMDHEKIQVHRTYAVRRRLDPPFL